MNVPQSLKTLTRPLLFVMLTVMVFVSSLGYPLNADDTGYLYKSSENTFVSVCSYKLLSGSFNGCRASLNSGTIYIDLEAREIVYRD
jgi:hypothetical protein